MNDHEQKHFDQLYQRHVRALKLHGYAASTIDVYARAVRRLVAYFDCLPDQIDHEPLEIYFAELVESHSWATVRVDRNGLHISEVEKLIAAARKLRYRVFVLATYSMGLRLSETLSLQVGDVDAARGRVHIRRGKGHKDRFVPLPNLTCQALRALWVKHRHPRLLFPNAVGSPERIRAATTHMDRGGTQKAVKVLLGECGIKKRSPFTPCATVLPPTCWNRA